MSKTSPSQTGLSFLFFLYVYLAFIWLYYLYLSTFYFMLINFYFTILEKFIVILGQILNNSLNFFFFLCLYKLYFFFFLPLIHITHFIWYSYMPILDAERQVQRRVKSASVSEPTSRVRCNVCYAPRLKHKCAKQTKNADLQTTSAEQDKTKQTK